MDENQTCAEAMLVHGGKILAVGSNAEISAYHVREQVDLKHQPVLPGLIDTHCHIPEMVDDSRKVDLAGAQSIQEVIDLMSKRLSTLKSGQWLLGKGLSSALLAEQRLPNRYDLIRLVQKSQSISCPLMDIVIWGTASCWQLPESKRAISHYLVKL